MKKWLLSIPIILITSNIYGATITWSKNFDDGQTLSGSDFDNLQTDITAVVNAGGGPVTLTASQTISGDNTFSGTSTFSGAISATGNTTLGNAVTDNITLTGAIQGASALILDGATDNTNEITFSVTDPTADRTITIPDSDGTFIVQTVQTSSTASITGTTVVPFDDSIPQITEGVQAFTVAITPKNANNMLIIEANLCSFGFSAGGNERVIGMLFEQGTANALAVAPSHTDTIATSIYLSYRETAGGTSAITYEARFGSESAGTTGINVTNTASARMWGGSSGSYIRVTEVALTA